MTKELSKQLCELCGVKRKKIILQQNCDKTCKYRSKTDTYDPCKRGGNICPERIKYLYPDFGQPENFVKLYEAKVGSDTLAFYVIQWVGNKADVAIFDRKFFLLHLTRLLNSGHTSEELKDKIKQAIREEAWKYE